MSIFLGYTVLSKGTSIFFIVRNNTTLNFTQRRQTANERVENTVFNLFIHEYYLVNVHYIHVTLFRLTVIDCYVSSQETGHHFVKKSLTGVVEQFFPQSLLFPLKPAVIKVIFPTVENSHFILVFPTVRFKPQHVGLDFILKNLETQ